MKTPIGYLPTDPTFGRHLSKRLSTRVSRPIPIIPVSAKIEDADKDLIGLEGGAGNSDHET